MAKKYPAWKILVWRMVRVFGSSFLAQISIDLMVANDMNYFRTILISAIAAGIAGVAKALREDKTFTNILHKLPI